MTEQVPEAVAPPRGNPRFPAIDGLRAVAAITVIVYHADLITGATHTGIGRIFDQGGIGVTLFFVITGFLLYRPMVAAAAGFAPPTSTARFYLRRVLRIAPAYWFALAVLVPVLHYAHPAGIANVLFLQIYRPAWVRSGIPPGWSVCVEMSFYALLPIYARTLHRRWRALTGPARQTRELRTLACLAIMSLVYRELIHLAALTKYMTDPLPGTLGWFCIGMAIAVCSVHADPRSTARRIAGKPWLCWTAAAIIYAATVLTTFDLAEESVTVFALYGLAAALILLPLTLAPPERYAGGRLLQTAVMSQLGLVSYGIYLYHYPLMTQLNVHTGSVVTSFLLLSVIGIAVGVTCGSLSYYLIERPALTLKNASLIGLVRRGYAPRRLRESLPTHEYGEPH